MRNENEVPDLYYMNSRANTQIGAVDNSTPPWRGKIGDVSHLVSGRHS